MEVRLAGQADARALAELRYAFRAEMAAPEEPQETFLERVTAWLTDRLEAGTWTAWVASASGQPVGLVLVHLAPGLHPGGGEGRSPGLRRADRRRSPGAARAFTGSRHHELYR